MPDERDGAGYHADMQSEPVGVPEIVTRLGVERDTGYKWKSRGVLPPPDYGEVNGLPAWKWTTILRWAGDSGRLKTDALRAEYRTKFKRDPRDREVRRRLVV